MSGDEFAIAVPTSDIGENVSRFAEQIGAGFDAPLLAGNAPASASGSASAPPSSRPTAARADELLSNSHMALSRAKATRRGGHVLFEDSIRRELETRLTLEAELALAAERNEFELFYQPQLHLADGRLIGAEALIRWRHPVRGLVSPGGIHAGRQHLADFRADRRMGSRNRLRQGSRLGTRRTKAPHRRQPFALAAPVG